SAAIEAERRKAEEEARILRELKPGQLVPGRGVFIGTLDRDDAGRSLGAVFNLFADTRDMNERQAADTKFEVTCNEPLQQMKDGYRGCGGQGCSDLPTRPAFSRAPGDGP